MAKVNAQIKNLLQDFKTDLQHLYGKRLVTLLLYGSYARGQETETSDIDVLIILSDMQSPYFESRQMTDIKYKILDKYEQVISVLPTTQSRYKKMEIPLYKNIKREGIKI